MSTPDWKVYDGLCSATGACISIYEKMLRLLYFCLYTLSSALSLKFCEADVRCPELMLCLLFFIVSIQVINAWFSDATMLFFQYLAMLNFSKKIVHLVDTSVH